MAKSKSEWTINHNKAYIALSLCIADGVLNNFEKAMLKECVGDWVPRQTDQEYASFIAQVVERMSKAKGGVGLLAGVQKASSNVAKELSDNKKMMFRFLKQLKSVAEADGSIKTVGNEEARVIRYVSNGLGFGNLVSITTDEQGLNISRN